MKPAFTRFTRTGFTALTLSLLAACASMADIPPGTPVSQVETQFGAPNYTCPEPNGGQRLIWSKQPYGQYAWGTRVDKTGRTDRIEQLLTDAHFRVLKQGVWTQKRVLCEFGPPADIDSVGLPSVSQIVWSYRYRQDGVWNSLMYVYFGKDGSKVTRVHPGPDPAYDVEDMGFF